MACTELTPAHMELLQAIEDSGGMRLGSPINQHMASSLIGLRMIELRGGVYHIMPDGASALNDWRELDGEPCEEYPDPRAYPLADNH